MFLDVTLDKNQGENEKCRALTATQLTSRRLLPMPLLLILEHVENQTKTINDVEHLTLRQRDLHANPPPNETMV